MSIKGFTVDGQDYQYNYPNLDNIPEITPESIGAASQEDFNGVSEEVDALKSESYNLLDPTGITPYQSTSAAELTRTGFIIKNTTEATYSRGYLYLTLKPNTEYTFSAKKHTTSGVAYVGYSEAPGEGEPFPSANIPLIGRTAPDDETISKTFTTTTGILVIRFYAAWDTAELGEVEYSEIMVFEGTDEKPYVRHVFAQDDEARNRVEAAEEKLTELDDLSGEVDDLKSAISIIADEQYSVGSSIAPASQSSNYRITANGVTSDNTRTLKVYSLGSKPIYIKSQDGIQYRSGTSASTTIETILGAFDGWVYPHSGANYIAISFETSAAVYGAWESVSDFETTYKTATNNANAIAENGKYFSEVLGTSSSTTLFEDVATALSPGDFLIVNFYSMEGATWSKLQVYGYDAQNVSTRLLNVSSVGSYLLPISASYVKIRVRVDGFTNPTSPKLTYGLYKSTDLFTLSGTIAFLRGKVSELESANVLKGATINCLGDSFTDDSTSYAHVLSDRISDLTTVLAAKGNSAIVTDAPGAPSFLSRIDGTAPKEGGGYYTGLSTAANITIIFGGINDCRDLGSGAITLGTIDSAHDTTTFYGGMQLLLDRIIAMCTDQFMLGVIPPSFQPNAPYTTYIGQVQEAERETFKKYHVPYVDLAYDCYAMSDNVDVMTLYRKSVVSPTNYHPNALGAKKICDLIQGKLETMYQYDT